MSIEEVISTIVKPSAAGSKYGSLTEFGKLDPCWVKVLDQGLILSQADFDEWSKKVEDGNWEGFMLRHNIPFETGRTKNLLKVKKFFDAEYKVEDVLVDQLTFKEPGKGR